MERRSRNVPGRIPRMHAPPKPPGRGPGRRGVVWALALAATLAAAGAQASEPSAPRDGGATFRVGTSGDYAPFSQRNEGGALEGLDVEVARAFAHHLGRAPRFVLFDWPDLLADLEAGRFDVAMGGVTVRPDRSLAGRYSVPVAEGGAVVLTGPERVAEGLGGLDAPDVRIAVNAGGHLERVTRARFPRAAVLAVPDNAAVPGRLRRGEADAVVTDTFEAPHWRAELPETVRLGPFTRDRKAYLLPPQAAERAAALDAWLLAREADGTLDAFRRRSLGAGAAEAAPGAGAMPAVLAALVAAVDERLALMPLVARVKRATGVPVHVPEQESRVLAAARRAVQHAARDAGRPPPPDPAVDAFFRAQFAAARALQEATPETVHASPEAARALPDLDTELRPALLRIGERMARLVVALPSGLDPDAVQAFVERDLEARELGDARGDLADAIAALVATPREPAPARAPAHGGAAPPRPAP